MYLMYWRFRIFALWVIYKNFIAQCSCAMGTYANNYDQVWENIDFLIISFNNRFNYNQIAGWFSLVIWSISWSSTSFQQCKDPQLHWNWTRYCRLGYCGNYCYCTDSSVGCIHLMTGFLKRLCTILHQNWLEN